MTGESECSDFTFLNRQLAMEKSVTVVHVETVPVDRDLELERAVLSIQDVSDVLYPVRSPARADGAVSPGLLGVDGDMQSGTVNADAVHAERTAQVPELSDGAVRAIDHGARTYGSNF